MRRASTLSIRESNHCSAAGGFCLEIETETGFRDPYRFTGKELEVEPGIMYLGARWYNPQLGRWLSPDPLYLVSTAKNAEKDQNIYHYAGNNPWKFVDPDGFKKTLAGYPKDLNSKVEYFAVGIFSEKLSEKEMEEFMALSLKMTRNRNRPADRE